MQDIEGYIQMISCVLLALRCIFDLKVLQDQICHAIHECNPYLSRPYHVSERSSDRIDIQEVRSNKLCIAESKLI